jgi:hypothetical protein
MKINLNFSEPVCYSAFIEKHMNFANYPGIYIWGFKNDKKFTNLSNSNRKSSSPATGGVYLLQ